MLWKASHFQTCHNKNISNESFTLHVYHKVTYQGRTEDICKTFILKLTEIFAIVLKAFYNKPCNIFSDEFLAVLTEVKSLLKWWFKAEVTIRSLYADLENLSSNMHINNETTNSQVSNKGTKVVAILISLMQTIMPIFTKHFSEQWLSCDHVLTIRVHNVCL